MKPVLKSFVFLLFTLSGVFNYTHAIELNYAPQSFLQQQICKQHFTSTAKNNACINKAAAEATQADCLINVEEDDDSEDDDTIDKQAIESRDLIAFYYALISTNAACSTSAPLPFCKHLAYLGSCKYIAQRVLRI